MQGQNQEIRQRSYSSVLNPEYCLQQLPSSQFLIPSMERAKQKIQSVLTKQSYSVQIKNQQRKNRTIFLSNDITKTEEPKINRNQTISKMVKDRHDFENRSLALKNHWKFVSHRILLQKKKKKEQNKRQREKEEIMDRKESYKSFIHEEINNTNRKQIKHKLNSKRSVLSHRQTKRKALQLKSQEKLYCGEQIRNQTREMHRTISEFKDQQIEKNKSAYLQMKQIQKKLEEERIRRLQQKKNRAVQNFNNKWMAQYEKKQKAEKKQRSIRNKIMHKKSKIEHVAKTLNLQ